MGKKIVGAMVYGGIRQGVATALSPVTSGLPGGALADEFVMGGLDAGMYYYGPTAVRPLAEGGIIVEAAQVGQYIGQALMGGVASGTTTAGSDGIPVIG